MDTQMPGAVPPADDTMATTQPVVDQTQAPASDAVPPVANDEEIVEPAMTPAPAVDMTPVTPPVDEPVVADQTAAPVVGGEAQENVPESAEEVPDVAPAVTPVAPVESVDATPDDAATPPPASM